MAALYFTVGAAMIIGNSWDMARRSTPSMQTLADQSHNAPNTSESYNRESAPGIAHTLSCVRSLSRPLALRHHSKDLETTSLGRLGGPFCTLPLSKIVAPGTARLPET